MSNWSYSTPMNVPTGGAVVRANGGAGAQALTMRSGLDGARTPMGQQVPSAQYPDGYLGTINSRREDRLLDSLKNRLTQRSYQRGVHKGEKVDAGDYFWPDELRPDIGLAYEARGLRWTAAGTFAQRLVNGGKNFTSTEMAAAAANAGLKNPGVETLDAERSARMRRLLPGWR